MIKEAQEKSGFFINKCCAVPLVFLLLFSSPTFAMGERPDAACLTTETLRVEIGGEKFAFPRKIVRSLRGQAIKNILDERDITSDSKDACQYSSDPFWPIEAVSLDFYPKPCKGSQECPRVFINAYIYDPKRITHNPYKADTKEQLLQNCTPPKRPFSREHAKNWSLCKFTFEDEGLNITLRFRGGIYPPEHIEETQRTILQLIRQYRIEE